MTIFCYQHHINDWRRDTAGLSMEEKGVYREVLDALYFHGGSLPADIRRLERIVGVQTKGERKALNLVVDKFLRVVDKFQNETENGEFFVQKRVTSEIKSMNLKSEKASQSAKAKYNKNNDVTSANAERTEERTQSERISERTANHKPITNKNISLAQPTVPETARATPAERPRAGLAGKKNDEEFVADEMSVDKAKRGDKAYDPAAAASEILPGGWYDYAATLAVGEEQIYKSWKKFKEQSQYPFLRARWCGWINREKKVA